MKPHVARMMEEHEELRLKRDRLLAFMDTPKWAALEAWDRELLHRQHTAMETYLAVLGKRIERAKKEASG